MATTNPFDLLGEFDNDDPTLLIEAKSLNPVAVEKKAPAPAQSAAAKPAKLPSRPLPPAQAEKESQNEISRGGGRGRGRGRGRGGFNRNFADNGNTYNNDNGFSGVDKPSEGAVAGQPYEKRGYGPPRGSHRGPHRGGFNNGGAADGERPRRLYERHSGTGRGNEIKRDGAGRGNWGTATDEIALVTEEPTNDNEKGVETEKQVAQEDAGDDNKDSPVNETKEKEPENKEMTLEEYEKVLEEKRRALLVLKAEERKVVVDREFESMQLLLNKKSDDEVFVKLGSDKDKRRDAAGKEERAKKFVTTNGFLKPAERERYGGAGSHRGGRGRGSRELSNGRNMVNNVDAPSIDDIGQFPSLCAK